MNSVVYEFWASISGLEPGEVFTLEQHMGAVFDQRVGESLYQAARRVLGPTGSAQELDAFFVPYLNTVELNDLIEVYFDTFERFYTSQRTTVRENLVLNPRMLNMSGWTKGAPNVTPTANGLRFDVVADLTSNNHLIYQLNTIPVTGGDVVSGSYEVTVPVGYPAARFQVRANAYSASSFTSVGEAVTVQPGQTATISSSALTTRADDNSVRVILQTNGTMVAGTRFIVRNALVEKTPEPGPYFDGSTHPKLARNIATNPSFESSGVVEVRRNLFTNPAVTSVAGFPNLAAQSDMSFTGSAVRWTAKTASWTEMRIDGSMFATGDPARLLVRARASKALKARMRIRDGAGADAFLTTDWQWFETVGTAGAGAGVQTGLYLPAPHTHTAGDWVEIDQVLLAPGDDSGDWFSGASSPDADMVPSWVGGENVSASTLSVAVPVAQSAATTPITSQSVMMQSKIWAKSGYNSMRIIPAPVGSSTNTFYQIGGYDLSILAPGRTYTALVTLRMDAPQTSPGTQARRLEYLDSRGGTFWLYDTAPNEAGVHNLRIAFTVPATGVSWATIRLWNGGTLGSGDVWWDDFALIEGDYDGPYFDGAIRPKGLASAWEGTEYLSASYLYDPQYTVTWSSAVDYSTSLMVKYND